MGKLWNTSALYKRNDCWHTPSPPHIHIEHRASGDQASVSIQGDDTLMEQNVANNTVVKKPHAGNSGAAAGARPAAAAASMTDMLNKGNHQLNHHHLLWKRNGQALPKY